MPRRDPKRTRAYKVAWQLKRRHELGTNKPMGENRLCSSFLGVHVAETVLSRLFKNVERLPYGTSGGDFICGKGFLIDCKSGCIDTYNEKNPRWKFKINKNTVAQYFLLLAFDNRTMLNPQHVWLIPGSVVNNRIILSVTNSSNALAKWSKYEHPLDKVLKCCEALKENNRA